MPLAGLVDEAEAGLVAKAFGVAEATLGLGNERFRIARPDLEGQCLNCLGVPQHVGLLTASVSAVIGICPPAAICVRPRMAI